MAKKNNGKSLEKTIQLIQETFKNSENTQVFPSSKLLCESGIEREFDVLIKSKINDFDICIAIECKDYGAKVSIDRIEGFKAKCSTIKEINKMVFVSSRGYQSGAIKQAKNFGIDLLTAEQVSLEYIQSIMPDVMQFNMEISQISEEYKVTLQTRDLILPVELSSFSTDFFIDGKTHRQKTISEIIIQAVNENGAEIQNLALQHFIKYKDQYDNKPPALAINFGVDFPSGEFYVDFNDLPPIEVLRLDFSIEVSFNLLNTEPSGRIVRNLDESIKAHSMKFNLGENIESEIIITPDNDFSFFYTENSQTTKLKKLFAYDPKTNKFTQE